MSDENQIRETSFEAFYEKFYPIVLCYLQKRCSSASDAEDLTAQVFLYCFRNWECYDPARASRETWLFMVMKSRFKNYCRDRRDIRDIDDYKDLLHGEDPIERAAELDDARNAVADALLQLPEKQRKAIVMRFFGDMDDATIAKKLGITVGHVRVLVFRGLKKMQRYLLHTEWSEGRR